MALYLGEKLIATAADMKDRFHFKGQLTLEATRTDWEDLIPTKKAQVYYLVNDTAPSTTVTIDGETYSVGDWVFITNDVETGETGVEAIKLTSSSEAIKIVDVLPTTDINNKMFYVVPTGRPFSYTTVQYYVLKDSFTGSIAEDGIYDATGNRVVEFVDNVTNYTQVQTYCYLCGSPAQAILKGDYIVSYMKDYGGGAHELFFCKYTKAPFEPYDPAWNTPVNETPYSVYLYNVDKTEWNCIYPVEADAITYVEDVTKVIDPKATVLYAVPPQTDIKYYKLIPQEIAAGSTITATEINFLFKGQTITFAQLLAGSENILMNYNLQQATEATADNNCVVIYKINGTQYCYRYADFVKNDKTQVYIYNGTTFELIYPQDTIENVLVHVQLTKDEYEKVIAGTSVLYTYDENTVYDITDAAQGNPEAYLKKINIMSSNAIVDVTTLPTSAEELAKINKNSFYRTTNTKSRYTNIEYYDLGAVYYIADDPTDADVKVIAWNDATATVNYGAKVAELREDEATWDTNKTSYDITATTAAAITSDSIVTYKDSTSTTPDKWIVAPAEGLDLTETVDEDEIYFYSQEASDWICIYPSAVDFEDIDINFEDATEWYPIKP